MLILIYFLFIIIILYVVFRMYIMIKSPFWSRQPVFHFYDFQYFLSNNKIIDTDKPIINRYVDLVNIHSYDYDSISNKNEIKNRITNFVRENYLNNKYVKYLPTQQDIFYYLSNNYSKSFLSIYKTPNVIYDNDNTSKRLINDYSIEGCITARPLEIEIFNPKINNNIYKFKTYYVDNLCVSKSQRKKGIAPKLIQTIYYNLRNKNKNIKTCLFKREGDVTLIVPITIFKTHIFNISNISNSYIIPNPLKSIQINKKNINLFVDFIKNNKQNYRFIIKPELNNLIHLLDTEKLIIYGLFDGVNLVSSYIFRYNSLFYNFNNKMEKTIECIATINNSNNDIFVKGFINSLNTIKNKEKIQYLLIENTSCSNIIIKWMRDEINIDYLNSSKTAFYFYNYIYHSIKSNECLTIY